MYTGTKIKEGILPNLTISEAPAKDHFGYDFHTYLKIPEKGFTIFTYIPMTGPDYSLTAKKWLTMMGRIT